MYSVEKGKRTSSVLRYARTRSEIETTEKSTSFTEEPMTAFCNVIVDRTEDVCDHIDMKNKSSGRGLKLLSMSAKY